jgi:hypothetical protein
MPSHDGRSPPALGFLTVVRHEPHGFFGGYLVLNQNGRPLEFHCTAPVKPNRAQEILYGPTLEPFLYGEQIGCALLERSAVEVRLIWTDRAPVLAVREHVSTPVALVMPPDAAPGGDVVPVTGRVAPVFRVDPAHVQLPIAFESPWGHHRFAVSASRGDDQQTVAQVLESLGSHFDVAEPFTRIREAIDEAQRSAR